MYTFLQLTRCLVFRGQMLSGSFIFSGLLNMNLGLAGAGETIVEQEKFYLSVEMSSV